MILFPNCKINLGLNIIRKRPDGYHDIATVFYPVPFHDVLEIIPAADRKFGFSVSGLEIPGETDKNLCIKAYKLLKSDFTIPEVTIHLHKAIPMGAGLGGGSSDGAFTLMILNQLFDLKLDEPALIDYALKLGSDCPFFILNRPLYATGRGHLFELSPVNLSGWHMALIFPGVHAATAEAYAQVTPRVSSRSLKEIVTRPVSDWKNLLINDFERMMERQFPVIGQIKAYLFRQGAVYAAMTGSGSAVYALFTDLPELSFADPVRSVILKL